MNRNARLIADERNRFSFPAKSPGQRLAKVRALIARPLGNRPSFIADSTTRWLESMPIASLKTMKAPPDRLARQLR
jgi:hypothetical protein